MVRSDCAKWLTAIEESIPSVVVAVVNPEGADVSNARLLVDGEVMATKLDGRPVALDPGEHVFRLEADGYGPITESVVVRAGERNRLVRFRVGAPTPATPPPVAPPPAASPSTRPTRPPPAGSGGGIPTGAIIAGGVGVVALGSFAYFGATSKSDLDGLRSTCAPFCEQSKLDDVKSRMLIADLSLGVGIVALGTAAVLLVIHPSGRESAKTERSFWNALRVDVGPSRGGASAQVKATF